jgi:hypothetical protein
LVPSLPATFFGGEILEKFRRGARRCISFV